MDSARFKLLIVDDHPVVLSGLRFLFRDRHRFKICAEAATAAQGRVEAETCTPDIIIADLVLGGRDGLNLIEDLTAICPTARILVYSSHDERVYARLVLRAGARGYISKGEGLEKVAEAVDTILSGNVHVSPAVQIMLVSDYVEPLPGGTTANLSPRELQVLQLIGDGLDLQSLARGLMLSVKTIGTYRERLKNKLGLDSQRALERFAADYAAMNRAP